MSIYTVEIDGIVCECDQVKVSIKEAWAIALNSNNRQLLHSPYDDDGDWEFRTIEDRYVAWHTNMHDADKAIAQMELEDCHTMVLEEPVILLQLDYRPVPGWYVYTDGRTGEMIPVKIVGWNHHDCYGWMGESEDMLSSYFQEDLKPWSDFIKWGG